MKKLNNRTATAVKKVFVNIIRYFFLISLSYIVLYQMAYMLSMKIETTPIPLMLTIFT